jgi:hypothetical protein
MTEFKKLELRSIIEEQGFVEVTVVPYPNNEDEKSHEVEFSSYEEALAEIEILENENEVFF